MNGHIILGVLDIFAHSRDVMLRNDVADALQRRDAVAVRGALQLLISEYPSNDLLPALNTLTWALGKQVPERFGDHDALRHGVEAQLICRGRARTCAGVVRRRSTIRHCMPASAR
ncbi:hypothetical protein [Cupriavidus basilensis]|uniref:hypothetical protein n=1 Tax=Cupriavidus basilensis TaxID=68895 RepID=UPI0023E843E9|nr:hypothetical protein [Cupriavidus basilensis]MDF3888055.1 hypothetical protein [Cupriavidus basilensis]